MTKRYYSLVRNGSTAELDIYGEITSYPWCPGDVSAANLSRQLEELDGVDTINVHINSYGGEVAEGLAIYNALRRNKAKVVTTCDGFACSIASVIFMAGDERIMCESSLIMIHNAWSYESGDASDLRKAADDLDKITQASKAAYLSRISVDEAELSLMMDDETWICPEDALSMGFATRVERHSGDAAPSQCAVKSIMQMVRSSADAARSAASKGRGAEAEDEDPDEEEPGGSDDSDERRDDESDGAADDDADGEAEDEDPDEKEPGGSDDSDERRDDESGGAAEDPDDEKDKPNKALQSLGRFLLDIAGKDRYDD